MPCCPWQNSLQLGFCWGFLGAPGPGTLCSMTGRGTRGSCALSRRELPGGGSSLSPRPWMSSPGPQSCLLCYPQLFPAPQEAKRFHVIPGSMEGRSFPASDRRREPPSLCTLLPQPPRCLCPRWQPSKDPWCLPLGWRSERLAEGPAEVRPQYLCLMEVFPCPSPPPKPLCSSEPSP